MSIWQANDETLKNWEGEGDGREGKMLISVEIYVKQYFCTDKIQNFFQDDTASHHNA